MVTARRETTAPVAERRAFSLPGLPIAIVVIAAGIALLAWLAWLIWQAIEAEVFISI